MRGKNLFTGLMIAGAMIISLSSHPLMAAKLPRFVVMGTMPAGMLVNIQGAGIADVISRNTPMEVKIKAVTSEEVWVPMMLTNEVDVGVAVSLSMRNAYLGSAVYGVIAKQIGIKNFPLRLVTVGTPIRVGLIVRGDAPLQKISDLKGKRVVEFAQMTAFDLYSKALLANGGLSADDVKGIFAANPIEGTRAVMDGRADAAMVAVNAPITAEAVGKVNARWLPADDDPKAVKALQSVIATAYVQMTPGKIFVGVPTAQKFMHLDIYLVAHKDLDDEPVYEMTKSIYEHNSELLKKPMLAGWMKNRFVSDQASIPYHPGAIKFYKEQKLWSADAEQLQNRLLSEVK